MLKIFLVRYQIEPSNRSVCRIYFCRLLLERGALYSISGLTWSSPRALLEERGKEFIAWLAAFILLYVVRAQLIGFRTCRPVVHFTKVVSGAGHRTHEDVPGCKIHPNDKTEWSYQLSTGFKVYWALRQKERPLVLRAFQSILGLMTLDVSGFAGPGFNSIRLPPALAEALGVSAIRQRSVMPDRIGIFFYFRRVP